MCKTMKGTSVSYTIVLGDMLLDYMRMATVRMLLFFLVLTGQLTEKRPDLNQVQIILQSNQIRYGLV